MVNILINLIGLMLVMMNDKSGVVIDNRGPIYVINLDRPENAFWQIVRKEMRYQEIVYSSKSKSIFLYSLSEKSVFSFLPENNQFNLIIKCQMWGHVGKKMRLSKDNEDLILKSSDSSLLILLKIGFEGYKEKIKIGGIEGRKPISDFQAFGESCIMIVTLDGHVTLISYDRETLNFTKTGKFSIKLEDEESIVSSAICQKNTFLTITSYTKNYSLKNLYFFSLKILSKTVTLIDKIDQICFENFSFSQKDNSYISDISMEIYYQHFPLIFCVQGHGDKALLSYYYDGEKVKVFRKMRIYHSGYCRFLSPKDGIIWAIDNNGLVKRLGYKQCD